MSINNPRPGDGRLRILVECGNQAIDRAWSNHRVGVEEQDELAERLLDADVTGARKAEIRSQLDEPDSGPAFAYVGGGAIRRRVVDDDDLAVDVDAVRQ